VNNMTWQEIIKKEPKQGPRMSEEMYSEFQLDKYRDMQSGLVQVANDFKRNEKAIKDLMGKEGTEDILDAIADTLRTYGRYLSKRTSTDFDTFSGRVPLNQDNREYLEETGQKFLDLANEISKK